MFRKIVILSTFIVVSLAELPASGPYAPSGWRPQGASFDLPNEYFFTQAQRTPPVVLEITKERVDYAGQFSGTSNNAPQVAPNNAYLPPEEVDESSSFDIIRVQGLPSRPSVQFNAFRAPQTKLNTLEYFPQRQQIGQFRKPQKFSGNTNKFVFSRQRLSPIKFPSTQYGTPEVEQPSTQYGVPENQAVGYPDARAPEEPFNGESDKIAEDSVTKGEYFVLTPEKTLQKVSYKTSQTEEEARTNAFTAELKYTPVEKIDGPLYKYNEQGQLVRIYKK